MSSTGQSSLSFAKAAEIEKISINVLDPEVARRRAVVSITESTVYVKDLPKGKSVNDHHMGAMERHIRCGTCKQTLDKCDGHEAVAEMFVPLYHPKFLERVFKILRNVCHSCSKMLIPPLDKAALMKKTPAQRYQIIHSQKKEKKDKKDPCVRCPHCDEPQPVYSLKQSTISIQATWPILEDETPAEEKRRKSTFQAFHARRIISRISDEDCELMGIGRRGNGKPGIDNERRRPEWMITTALSVPPPCVRPSVVDLEGGKTRGHDDLTFKLSNILKANHAIGEYIEHCYGPPILFGLDVQLPSQSTSRNSNRKKVVGQKRAREDDDGTEGNFQAICKLLKMSVCRYEINPDMEIPQQLIDQLQYQYATYIDNKLTNVTPDTNKSGTPIKSIFDRFKGKVGRFRDNLNGKRVDFSARSVIAGDPMIDPDEVGIPYKIAKTQSFPERVNRYNIERLQEMVDNGPKALFGANNVINELNQLISLETAGLAPIKIQIGWIVERHLLDGDFVAFNRQPSLKDVSYMAHKAVLMPHKTIRLNLSVTTPYNADFDGDEMNLNICQSYSSVAELVYLMSASRHIVSSQSNKNVMGIVQNALVALFLFTGKDIFLERDQVMQLLIRCRYVTDFKLPTPCVIKPKMLWSGKQIFSMLLSPILHLERFVRGLKETGDIMDQDERYVNITRGELLTGTVCKQTVGAAANSIVHIIYKDCGHEAANRFLGDAQRMGNQFLQDFGFSISLNDCKTSTQTKQEIQQLVSNCDKRIQSLYKKHKLNPNDPQVEAFAAETTNKMLDQAGSIIQKDITIKNNNIHAMSTCGSKGNPTNVTLIRGYLGQQSSFGQRIQANNDKRTLSCFSERDKHSIAAKGFCGSSFEKGLTPAEYFFHGMGGREGLTDTTVKTSETGYLQRKMMKTTEDIAISYDQSVRNARKQIIQFWFGNDGLDGRYCEKIACPEVFYSNQQMHDMFSWQTEQENGQRLYEAIESEAQRKMLDDEMKHLIALRDQIRCAKMSPFRPTMDNNIMVAVSMVRFLPTIEQKWRLSDKVYADTPLTLESWTSITNRACDKLTKQFLHCKTFNQEQQGDRVYAIAGFLFHLRVHCSSLRMIHQKKYTVAQYTDIWKEVLHLFSKYRVTPGEMVGPIACSLVIEPATQQTLNTFHYRQVLFVDLLILSLSYRD